MNPVLLLHLAAGRTQQENAALAGTSQSAIAACEGGTEDPDLRTVEGLARAAGFEVELRVVPQLIREERRSLVLHAAVAGILSAVERAQLYRAFAQRERDDAAGNTRRPGGSRRAPA